jgi:gliding motility-associated protein GldL
MALINLKTHKAKVVLNVIFSVGASIVIFGALSKLEHWGGVLQYALGVGMITETLVFLLMAFQPPEEEYYWEKIIPNLNVHPREEKKNGNYQEPKSLFPLSFNQQPPSALSSMDKMLDEADITPASLKRLSENFQRLGNQVENMTDVTDVMNVTGEYAENTRQASVALRKMRDVYADATNTVASFNQSAGATQQFHEQIQQMTKNLSSLNAIYELELQDTNNHVKAMNHFYGNLSAVSESMAATKEDSQKTQQQVALLAQNLTNLNAVYGNMLSAMHSR